MTEKKYTIDHIKTILTPIAEKYGVERVFLFGSYAHNENCENSDLDLRIDKGSLNGLFALCGLYPEIRDSLGINVDIITTASLKDSFLNKIRDEEILLYEQ